MYEKIVIVIMSNFICFDSVKAQREREVKWYNKMIVNGLKLPSFSSSRSIGGKHEEREKRVKER
jgi:hypothetical protein